MLLLEALLVLAAQRVRAVMSTSLKVVSIAAVFCASFSRAATILRRRVIRTRSSRAPDGAGWPEPARVPATGHACAEAGAGRGGGDGDTASVGHGCGTNPAGSGSAALPGDVFQHVSFVKRPPGPLP